VTATPHSDIFADPGSGKATVNAPFYYNEVEGDFVFRAKIGLEFVTMFDACVLFAYEHDKLWAKACFEYTDLRIPAVVTVMTNEYSDDANCVNIDGTEVWLQLSRKGQLFAIHYSLDGEHFYMARITRLPMSNKIKVGVVAQSPIGQGGDRCFEFLSLEHQAPDNIRTGK
jgi:uncharacterized protein